MLIDRIKAAIAADGPMTFETYLEHALYDETDGFYAAHGQAGGRRGDFVTSVETGPLFAAVIADWLDRTWDNLGQPQRFRVSEVGAGVGTLFRGINLVAPRCFDAMTYTLVERSAQLRSTHESLPSERWQSLAALPETPQHVIVANELLDNLVFGIAECLPDGWAPVMVDAPAGELVFVVGNVDPALAHLRQLAPKAEPGDRVPVATAASAWMEQATARADRVLCFDYGASTAELLGRGQHGWLRTYAQHTRGSDPLVNVGHQDVTCDVPFDQLPVPSIHQTQADWLRANGLDDRVEGARTVWAERGHIGDLAAMRARSAINEATALTDPDSLGAFLVLEYR